MYGTVARLNVKPGMEHALLEFGARISQTDQTPGMVADYIFRLDSGAGEYIMVAIFADKAAYVANAESPQQQKRYQEYRALLTADPDWNDGEVVFAAP